LLRQCGYEVELSEAGCCGMAGTFGFEAEHHELSMQIAELSLFPRLRESMVDAAESGSEVGGIAKDRGSSPANLRPLAVTSTGASCRMHIRQGVGADVRHPIEWVREALLTAPGTKPKLPRS
jgi:Fe-S oxidoreductase